MQIVSACEARLAFHGRPMLGGHNKRKQFMAAFLFVVCWVLSAEYRVPSAEYRVSLAHSVLSTRYSVLTQGRFFPETGHTLAPEFVSFFDSNGGLPLFGYPITEARQEGG